MTSYLSPRMMSVGASPTAKISDTLRSLATEGHQVINLGEGELDFPTPAHIGEAAIAAIRAGETKYTAVAGTQALREAIRDALRRDLDLDYPVSAIIAGNGAKQLIFNAFLATLAPGDEVLIPAPHWVSYPDMVRLAGGTPVVVQTPPEDGWKLTPATLAAGLTEKTKWVVLNSPSNPTGAVYSAAELAALAAVLRDHHALIMADDIYQHMVQDAEFAAPAAVMEGLFDRILTINGLSKGYSMTGWRLGYAAGPGWLIRAMDVLQSQSTSNASTISQAAAIAALSQPMAFLPDWLARLRTRRDTVLAAIAAMPGIDSDTPPGAFYVFADCRALIGRKRPDGAVLASDVDVADYLLSAAHVGMVPGTAFGTPGYLRIAYAIDDRMLDTALARVTTALNALGS